MENSTFEVKGTFRIGDEWKPYKKTISAPNPEQAKEQTMAVIGSKHRLKRRYITIESVNIVHGE
jgi:large subunit ribosomal protein LX